jgi:hypothetical protein
MAIVDSRIIGSPLGGRELSVGSEDSRIGVRDTIDIRGVEVLVGVSTIGEVDGVMLRGVRVSFDEKVIILDILISDVNG